MCPFYSCSANQNKIATVFSFGFNIKLLTTLHGALFFFRWVFFYIFAGFLFFCHAEFSKLACDGPVRTKCDDFPNSDMCDTNVLSIPTSTWISVDICGVMISDQPLFAVEYCPKVKKSSRFGVSTVKGNLGGFNSGTLILLNCILPTEFGSELFTV